VLHILLELLKEKILCQPSEYISISFSQKSFFGFHFHCCCSNSSFTPFAFELVLWDFLFQFPLISQPFSLLLSCIFSVQFAKLVRMLSIHIYRNHIFSRSFSDYLHLRWGVLFPLLLIQMYIHTCIRTPKKQVEV